MQHFIELIRFFLQRLIFWLIKNDGTIVKVRANEGFINFYQGIVILTDLKSSKTTVISRKAIPDTRNKLFLLFENVIA